MVQAQPYAFRHLGTAEGLLSDLRLELAEDRQGRLWISSDEGLNIFDGYQLTAYDQPDSAVMKTNSVQQIFCDTKGTIWIATLTGIQYKPESDNRFRNLQIDSGTLTGTPFFGETKEGNLLMAGSNGCYQVLANKQILRLQGLDNMFDQFKSPMCFEYFSGDEWLVGFRRKLLLVNIKEQKIIKELPLTSVWCAAKVNDSIILAGSFVHDTIALINIVTGQSTPISNWPCSDGNGIGGYAGTIKPIGNNKFAIATRYYGVYILDLNKRTAIVLQHNPADPYTIKTNACRKLFITRNNTLFVQNRGISFTQLNTPQFKSQKYLINKSGDKYDNGFTSMVQDRKKNYWVGTNANLALWDRKTNTSIYYPFYDLKRGPQKFKTVRAVVTDKLDRVWVGTFGGGMGLLLPGGGFEQYRRDTTDPEHSLPSLEILSIAKDRDENFLICTNGGFVFFDPVAKKMQTFFNHPNLSEIAGSATYGAFADKKNNWWLAQNKGLYYYDRKTDSLHTITIPVSQKSKQMQVVATDSNNVVYAGGVDGLYIISPGTLKVQKVLGKKDGLASNNIVGLLCDKGGDMWILGNIGAARYNPATGSLQSFDAIDGMDQSNHYLNNVYMAADGEVLLTSFEGFNYFYPNQIKPDNKPLRVFVTAAELRDTIISMPDAAMRSFEYYQNNVSFSYLSVDFKLGTSVQYRYQLQGFDTAFIYAGKGRTARYTNLPAGHFTFLVEASINGKDWYAPAHPVQFSIDKAFWTTWLFILLMIVFIAAIAGSFFYLRVQKIRKEEAVKRDFEGKISQMQMNLLRTQMNPHFLFNSLNGINSFILKNDRLNASGYLTKFSRLMRLILDNSRTEWVSLESELKAIELYVQLEALRFSHSFEYQINTEEEMDTEDILLPPMLIQPYVENAIWHGLMYRKEPGGLLLINVSQYNGTLQVQIKDNGVGRNAAAALKSKSALQQKSYGMKITTERINIVNETYKINANAAVKDLTDADGNATGTEVTLTLDKITDRV